MYDDLYSLNEDNFYAQIPARQRPDQRPTNQSPIISNNPEVFNFSVLKNLTGYPNYGNPSGNADILYTGNTGEWNIRIPNIFRPNLNARLIIRAVLDDHSNVPIRNYSARISFNGTIIHNGPVALQHGTPVGGRFTNWRNLSFPVYNLRNNNRLVIVNTSNTGTNDWIGLDWFELQFRQ